MRTQQHRLLWRSAFFLLFLLAPILDIFRFDLALNHLILLGQPWVLGINSELGAQQLFINLSFKLFLPLFLFIGIGFWIVWKWGRLYCGWLCPHFSVVETINGLMRRASAKPSLWEKQPLPNQQKDGSHRSTTPWWWPITLGTILIISWVWAVALLTYLVDPTEIYENLWHGELTSNQFTFITVGTVAFAIEFTFARHLFCRFGCAIGLFQSLIWMANKGSMVVAFDRNRAALCGDCDQSCEHACPMRLKPRSFKRNMFTCTQCLQCVSACNQVQQANDQPSLLKLLERQCALSVSDQGLGKKEQPTRTCFETSKANKRHC